MVPSNNKRFLLANNQDNKEGDPLKTTLMKC